MEEFTISFWYNNREQRAGVVRTEADGEVKYNIRPIDITTVEKFGKQITILKENESYRINKQTDKDHQDFFNALISAIKGQDIHNGTT